MKRLDVYLHNNLLGHLIQNENGHMVFNYLDTWLENPNAYPLSHSLPLRKERFTRNECKGFFSGILPEEHNRKLIARNLGISAQNDFALLAKIGGECAGAITFMPPGTPLPEEEPGYRSLTDDDLASILEQLPRRPLMAGEDGVRLSLAGAQDKLAVQVQNKQVSIPLGNAPSTHILKPAIERYKDVVFNEWACLRLAAALDLPTANAEVQNIGDKYYLLVERYDRVTQSGQLIRLHQEDFCQCLAIPSHMKYQNEGGPSLKQCFDLLREISSAPVLDIQTMLNAVILNILIGNNDAHGKNFSLLYHQDGSTRLAPLYDLVSTARYPELSKKMAMKLGGEYRSDRINSRHFEKLADETGLAKPMLKRRVQEMAERTIAVQDALDVPFDELEAVNKLIKQRCEKALSWA